MQGTYLVDWHWWTLGLWYKQGRLGIHLGPFHFYVWRNRSDR